MPAAGPRAAAPGPTAAAAAYSGAPGDAADTQDGATGAASGAAGTQGGATGVASGVAGASGSAAGAPSGAAGGGIWGRGFSCLHCSASRGCGHGQKKAGGVATARLSDLPNVVRRESEEHDGADGERVIVRLVAVVRLGFGVGVFNHQVQRLANRMIQADYP